MVVLISFLFHRDFDCPCLLILSILLNYQHEWLQNVDEEQLMRKREMEKEQTTKQELASNHENLMTFIDIQFLIVYPLAYVYAYYQTIRPYFRTYQYHYKLSSSFLVKIIY